MANSAPAEYEFDPHWVIYVFGLTSKILLVNHFGHGDIGVMASMLVLLD